MFRVYISADMLGIELGGALKNVIALAAGIADGMGYGDNAKAALITRGIVEIATAWYANGRAAGDIFRSDRHRRSDRDVCEHAQPQPQSRHPDGSGQNDGRGYAGG